MGVRVTEGMDPTRWQRVKAIFAEVVDEPPERHADLVAHHCGNDEALRDEVLSLLAAHGATSAPLGPELPDDRPTSGTTAADAYAGRRFGAYRILREIGRGGMGAVFLAERADGAFHRQVALKIVGRTFSGDDMLRRFRRERQILATLNHPHIAHLLDGGVSAEGEPFFVMEYVDGVRIDEYCTRHARTQRERLALMADVCRAVAHAHAQQIIHRDLKPSNILVTAAGVPKLLDFGIARVTESPEGGELTLTEYQAFTPEYASPEQASGAPVLTPATDVFSLGVLLAHLLDETETTGKTEPTPGPTGPALRARPTRRLSSLPRELRCVVARATHIDASRRYESAAALADDITRYLDGRPVLARPDGLGYRIATFVRQRKVPIAVAALAIAALLTGAFVATYSLGRVPVSSASVGDAVAPGDERTMAVLPLLVAPPEGGTRAAPPSTADRALRVGLADAIATRLGRIPSLAVRPVDATLPYLDRVVDTVAAGRELEVDTVLEGTLARTGTRLQTTLRLVDVASGHVAWQASFVSDLAHVLMGEQALATQVSRGVSTALSLPFASARPAADTTAAAQEAYLDGNLALAMTRRDVSQIFAARDAFARAIRLDPDFAAAQAGLASAFTRAASMAFLAPTEAYPRAERAARRALELDPDLAAAHVALAEVEGDYNWRWADAEAHLRRALVLEPTSARVNHSLGEFLASHGRFAEAAEFSARARALDPTLVNFVAVRGLHYYLEHRFDEAIAESRKALAQDPQTYLAYLYMAAAYAARGNPADGLEAARAAAALSGGAQSDIFVMACNQALLNDRPAALTLLNQLLTLRRTRYIEPFQFVGIYAYLGDTERAFEWLERAYEERSYWMPTLKVHPMVDSLRGDPRFAALLARMRLE